MLPVRDCRRGRNDFSSDRTPCPVNLDNFKFKFVDKYSSTNLWITISNIHSKQQKCHTISEGWPLVVTIEQFCSFASVDRAGQLPKFCADLRTLQSQNFEPEFLFENLPLYRIVFNLNIRTDAFKLNSKALLLAPKELYTWYCPMTIKRQQQQPLFEHTPVLNNNFEYWCRDDFVDCDFYED